MCFHTASDKQEVKAKDDFQAAMSSTDVPRGIGMPSSNDTTKITGEFLFNSVMAATPDFIFGYPVIFPPFKQFLEVVTELKSLHADFQVSPDDPVVLRDAVAKVVQFLVSMLEDLQNPDARDKWFQHDSDGSLWYKIGPLLTSTLQTMSETYSSFDMDAFASRAIFLGQPASVIRGSGYDPSKPDGGVDPNCFCGLPKAPIYDFTAYFEMLHTGERQSPIHGLEAMPIESKILLEFARGGWTREFNGGRSWLDPNSVLVTDEMHELNIRREAIDSYTANWHPRRKAAFCFDISQMSWFLDFANEKRTSRNSEVHKAMLKTKTDLIMDICDYLISPSNENLSSTYNRHTQTPSAWGTIAEPANSETPTRAWDTNVEPTKTKKITVRGVAAMIIQKMVRQNLRRLRHRHLRSPERRLRLRRSMPLSEYLACINEDVAPPSVDPIIPMHPPPITPRCSVQKVTVGADPSPADVTDMTAYDDVEPVFSFMDMSNHAMLTTEAQVGTTTKGASAEKRAAAATKAQLDTTTAKGAPASEKRAAVPTQDDGAENFSQYVDRFTKQFYDGFDKPSDDDSPLDDRNADSRAPNDSHGELEKQEPRGLHRREPLDRGGPFGSYGYVYDGGRHHYTKFQGFDDDRQRYVEYAGFRADPHSSSSADHDDAQLPAQDDVRLDDPQSHPEEHAPDSGSYADEGDFDNYQEDEPDDSPDDSPAVSDTEST